MLTQSLGILIRRNYARVSVQPHDHCAKPHRCVFWGRGPTEQERAKVLGISTLGVNRMQAQVAWGP
jgi:hypothetical protein